MPRFKLVLQDAAGKSRSATVEAATQGEAVEMARRKGFQVRQIEPVYDIAPEELPPEPADGPMDLDPESEPAARPGRRKAGGGALAGLFADKQKLVQLGIPSGIALFALLIAGFTLLYVLFSDPLGSGMGKYDFSSPQKSYESRLKMQKNFDLRAIIAYNRKFGAKDIEEELGSWSLRKEAEFGGRKVLFITFKDEGATRNKVLWFEKDSATEYWVPARVKLADVEKDDAKLARQINHFLATGDLLKDKD